MSSTYVALNVAAGTQNITVTFDASLYDFQFCATEAYDVSVHLPSMEAAQPQPPGTRTIASGSIYHDQLRVILSTSTGSTPTTRF